MDQIYRKLALVEQNTKVALTGAVCVNRLIGTLTL